MNARPGFVTIQEVQEDGNNELIETTTEDVSSNKKY